MNKRTIALTDASYNRAVEELLNAKAALEFAASDEGIECEDSEFADEWREICTALQELGA